MSSEPNTRATEQPPHIIRIGGGSVPIQSPAGETIFGSTQGVSSSLASTILPVTEGGATAPGTHTANPGTRRDPSESRSITPHTTEDEDGHEDESPSIRASEHSRARRKGRMSKGDLEGENTPKTSVRFDTDEDDETIKREHDEEIMKAKEDFEQECEKMKAEIEKDYKEREGRVEERNRKGRERAQAIYEEKQKI
ncbi:hypothetical protein RhiJN_12595 [Ceratobasidium sp. AG-Ba]|nr:hypothetical protein RhiJN_12595 [Ceratobasidium sp. AG-Ba]